MKSELNANQFCLVNISKGFMICNLKKRLHGCVYDFLVYYESSDVDDILQINI